MGPETAYTSASDSESDSDDDDVVDGLMCLLDDPDPETIVCDPSCAPDRAKCPTDLELINFGSSKDGKTQYRDGSVLGHQAGVRLPQRFADADVVRLGIYLDTEQSMGEHLRVKMPAFCEKRLTASHNELVRDPDVSCKKQEVLLRPSELGPVGAVEFQKKTWELSKKFLEATGERYPKFMFVAIGYKNTKQVSWSISESFQVRSKEQSKTSKAALGLTRVPRRRRTPKLEALSSRHRAVEADILAERDIMLREESVENEYKMRLAFIKNIAESGINNDEMKQYCSQIISMIQ